MSRATAYLNDYGAFHATKGNKVCHVIGIPIIVLSALGMLDKVSFGTWDVAIIHPSLGLVGWALAKAFYLYLDLVLGASMIFTTAALYFAGAALSLPVLVGLQIFGWAIQFYGHAVYEKKKPAFLKNVLHFIIGPAYIQSYLFGRSD